ncbi:MAG TPA: sigma-70 family RNA polymerase sigma factor [Bryobacteraceae bacterium]|jgi:RNA polymerase sigma-70 factor (ECF subfamily)|nr:sigma-70 family RNA polymerase sigma factor [Bryobacteraceae bacterium]
MLQLATGEGTAIRNPQFSRLFEAYNGLIFRTAYRLTGSAADAEDVLQTIFLRLVRRDSEAVPAQGESYFRRAAVNASLDLIRARKADRSVSLHESAPAPATENRDLREELREAFATLTPRSAEIFVLRFIEGWTNAEIAQALGISQVLVAVTLHRTRRQLQKQIRFHSGGRS